jgi:RNA polymerase sigma-70 factor (subfamily 1)
VSTVTPTDSRFLSLLRGIRENAQHNKFQRATTISALLELYRPFLNVLAQENIPLYLRSKVARSDIVQETIWAAINRFDDFQTDTQDGFLAWLTTVCTNKATDHVRMYTNTKKRDYRREVQLSANESRDLLLDLAFAEDQRDRLASVSEIELLHVALASLKDHHRQVILWRIHDSLSWKQIGEFLESSPDACRMLHERALEKLRQHILRQVREPDALNY